MTMLTSGELAEVINELRRLGTDTSRYEAKSCADRKLPMPVWESVSAFANTEGGYLLLGLDEKAGFTIPEGFDPERVTDQFISRIDDRDDPSVLINPPRYIIDRVTADDGQIVVVGIQPNQRGALPCSIRARQLPGSAYRRVGDADQRMSVTEVFELQHQLSRSEEDRQVVPESSRDDLDMDLVEGLIAAGRGTRKLSGIGDTDAALLRLSITDREGQLRLAGLLVAGSYPQQFFPNLQIDVTTHPGREKSAPGSQLRFLDRVLCDGNLNVAVDDAIQAIVKNLRTYSVIDEKSSGRRDELEIPREVLREAVANAVVHREYASLFLSMAVTVDIYPDRVEIRSPGGLVGGKTKETLDDGVSVPRNQTLLQLLRSTPFDRGIGATVEGQGGGIPMMFSMMRQLALPEPTFHIGPDHVTVVLQRHGEEIPQLRARVREIADRPLTSAEYTAVLLADQEGVVTSESLRRVRGIDSREAERTLEKLRCQQVLQRQGADGYTISQGSPLPTPAEAEILRVLHQHGEVGSRDLAQHLGRNLNSLRRTLRRMVRDGQIEATAEPSSHLRRYRLPAHDQMGGDVVHA